MEQIKYHQVSPQNDNQSGFGQFSQIVFELSGDGRVLKPNSICLDAEINVFSTAATKLVNTDNITMDCVNGFHNYIGDITTENPNGQLEHINEYPRFYKSVQVATTDSGSYNSSMANAEGRDASNLNNARLQLVGAKASDIGNAAFVDQDFRRPKFSVKPLFCLNRTIAAQGSGYSFSDNGNIRVTFSLQKNAQALYGQDMVAGTNYLLKNVKLRYSTLPDVGKGKRSKIMMESVVNVKQTAQSAQTSIDARVPSKMCKGVLVNFLRQDKESDLLSNNNLLEQFPLLDKVNYRINDNQNGYISYDLETRSEFISNALKVLSDSGFNRVHARNIWSGDNYLIGTAFDNFLSLETNKLTIDLHSSSANLSVAGKGYIVYLYFMTLIALD